MVVSDSFNIDEDNYKNNDTINSSVEQTFGIFDENNNIENEFDNVDDVDENDVIDEDIDCDDGPTQRDKKKFIYQILSMVVVFIYVIFLKML